MQLLSKDADGLTLSQKPLNKSRYELLLLPNTPCNNTPIKRRGRKCFGLAGALKELLQEGVMGLKILAWLTEYK